jgi:hypothetical protein
MRRHVEISLFNEDEFSYEKFGGPQALPGGAKPHPMGVYPPEDLRLQDKRYVFYV